MFESEVMAWNLEVSKLHHAFEMSYAFLFVPFKDFKNQCSLLVMMPIWAFLLHGFFGSLPQPSTFKDVCERKKPGNSLCPFWDG